MPAKVATQELSAKKVLLQSLMKCPHRKLEETVSTFKTALEHDPLFAGKCFYALTLDEFNQIRDLEEAGIAFLLTSPHAEHREAGRVTFQTLEPYRAYRAASFIRSSLKVNRQVEGTVVDYLRTLEDNSRRFDGAVKLAADDLHKMYEFFHVKPSKRAQTILFDHKIEAGEVDVMALIKNAKSPEDQAELIVKYKVPYRQATSSIKNMTPTIWVALISVMSPSEALNSRASIEKSGILNDPEIRKLYEGKLNSAASDKRVASTTVGSRKSTKGSDESINRIMAKVEQAKIDSGARITSDTLVAVDCSGSLHVAIDLSKKICPNIAAMCDGKMAVYCFNDVGWSLKTGKGTIEDFRKSFDLVRANGSTSLGAALAKSIEDGFTPEQVVFVTDQGENRSPRLHEVFKAKAKDTKFVFINVGNFNHDVANHLEREGADVSEFDFTANEGTPGWYVNMNNFTTLLTKGGYTDLVGRIMALELPKR
jgi:hypothetical protein